MTSRKERGVFLGLRGRMLILFGSLFALILAAVSLTRSFGIPFTDFRGSYGQERTRVLENLELLADLKKERCLLWLEERKRDVRDLARDPTVIRAFKELRKTVGESTYKTRTSSRISRDLLASPAYQSLFQELKTAAEVLPASRELMAVDAATGEVLVSTDPASVGNDLSAQAFFLDALRSGSGESLDVKKETTNGESLLVLSALLKDPQPSGEPRGDPIGLIACEIPAEDFLRPILERGGRLGKTGESFLVDGEGRILLPLKHPLADGSEARVLETRIQTAPAILASKGKEGILPSRDYSGVPVLAAYRSLSVAPGAAWGMVVKQSESEVLALPRVRLLYSTLLGLAGVLLVLAATMVLSHRILKPVMTLSSTAEKVASGNLAARAPVSGSDEVARLAATFNTMVDRLQILHAGLEERVRQRTAEFAREVTDRRRAQEETRESERRLATLLSNLPGMAYRCRNDPDWTMEFVSQGCLELTGHDPSDLVGNRNLSYASLIHPEEREPVWGKVQVAVAGKIPFELLYRIRTVSGDLKWVWERGQGLFSEAGDLEGLEGFITDITALKRAEEKILELNAELEQRVMERTTQLEASNRELEAFAYSVSHDLRAPLRAIDGFSKILLEDHAGKLDAAGQDSLDRIRNATRHMGGLIDDLLLLSRVSRAEMRTTELDLSALAAEIAEGLCQVEPGRLVEFSIAPGLRASGDPSLLKLVMQNLLDNAWKFTGKHDRARIEFGAERAGGEKAFFVRDDGAGFDMAYSDKLFGAFQRLHGTGEFPGTGIGLATVQRIIHRHGGRVWARGSVEQGAVFYFTLPERNPMA